MSDLEYIVRPPFLGNGRPVLGTLDPFEPYDDADFHYFAATLPIEDSLSVVSIDGPPSMTDDDDAAEEEGFGRDGCDYAHHVDADDHAHDNDDEDVDGAILSWMASPDFAGDPFAAGGAGEDQRSNIESPLANDVRFGRGRT
jgi:hypothetical protein